ncbi:MAG: hypothetical protein EBX40_04015 [Gammaproteobacteria bacterium]|nr:hypothetical protein [Gammaproteobacteria bacterium]
MILGVLVALFGVAMQAKLLFWLSPILMAGGDVILYSVLVSELSNAVSARAQGRMMGMIYILTTSVWAFTGFVGGYLIGGHVEDVLIGMLGGISALWISLSWRGKARVRKGIVQLKN